MEGMEAQARAAVAPGAPGVAEWGHQRIGDKKVVFVILADAILCELVYNRH
jgi:hypothetical protein